LFGASGDVTIVKPALGMVQATEVVVVVVLDVVVVVDEDVVVELVVVDVDVVLVGSVSRCCVALAVNTMLWLPPKKAAMNGVNRLKCPSTVTLTVWPIPVVQSGLQVTSTSAGAIVTPPLDSSVTRQ
jgi:hypothetical protein